MKELYGLFVKMEEEVRPLETQMAQHTFYADNTLPPSMTESASKLPEISPKYHNKEKESPSMHYNKYSNTRHVTSIYKNHAIPTHNVIHEELPTNI